MIAILFFLLSVMIAIPIVLYTVWQFWKEKERRECLASSLEKTDKNRKDDNLRV